MNSWTDSSRTGPSTPQRAAYPVRIYNNPYDCYNQNFGESPFDPASTPSRGIKFYPSPFAYGDLPIRRKKSSDSPSPRRGLHSPWSSRSSGPNLSRSHLWCDHWQQDHIFNRAKPNGDLPWMNVYLFLLPVHIFVDFGFPLADRIS